HRDEGGALVPDELVARPRGLGLDAAAAERRPEIEQMVPHDRAAAGVHERIERVDAARIVVVEPGREDPQPAQLTPMLVREDVVGIVRARAVVAEPPHGFPRQRLARQYAVAAVLRPRGLLEERLELPRL